MISPKFRQRLAEGAIDFSLNAFYQVVVWIAVTAVGVTYAAVNGVPERWVYFLCGGFIAFVIILFGTGSLFWYRKRGRIEPVGNKGILDFRRDANAALNQIAKDIPRMTAVQQRQQEITADGTLRVSKLGDLGSKDVHERALRIAADVATRTQKQANAMRVRAEPVNWSMDMLIASLSGWSDWALKNGQRKEIEDVLLPMIREILKPLDDTIASQESFMTVLSTDIRSLSQDLDLATGALVESISGFSDRLKSLRQFCQERLAILK